MGCEFSKLYNLEIHLENDLGIFEPLDVVAGHVLIQVENDTTIHHCFLTLRGLAHFSFPNHAMKDRSGNRDEMVEEFQILLTQTEDLLREYKINDNIYLNEDRFESNCCPEFIITKGLHVFNFEFQLPAHLPASFVVPDVPEAECFHGFVIYNIKIEVVNVTHQVSHSRERDILVFKSLDLTQFPKLKDKITLRKEFQISECCTTKSKLLCELTVNKCAFVPGEILKVDVLVKNGSAKPIESVQLSLHQIVSTKSEKGEKSIQLRLFSIGMGSVSPHRVHSFSDNIHIPPVVASGLVGCEILDVSYSLIAQLFVFGDKSKRKDLYLKIPITIGSDPVKDASFGENKEAMQPGPSNMTMTKNVKLVPCYALFDYSTGAVIEYVQLKVTSSVHHMLPVYRYYKPAPQRTLRHCFSQNFKSLSRSTSGHNMYLHQSMSSIKIDEKPSLGLKKQFSPSESDIDKIDSPKISTKCNSIEKFYVDRMSDAPTFEVQDSINLQVFARNQNLNFKYYLSEESSDVTESIW